ncbi:MAG TPA: leucine-rich repeat domain-containing protein, partial [Saprospiraceae bacterium]|nr:leucine-rich repeat domain-containing protein [Saprospiraceae bacterium]HMQ83388.1 leucine-rich repeat domain-containing protein [Saprospiraceae bacterium]
MSQLAQQLIEQEKAERTGYLDLGNCGLTQLPDLSELSWLHTLIASSRWYEFDPTKNKWQRFESKNTGPKNIIDPPEEPLPLSLKKIVLRDCHISDARFLQKLSKLTSLDLRSNQISDA